MKSLGPVAFTGLRFLLGALVILPLAWRDWKKLAARPQKPPQRDFFGVIGLGLLLTVGAIFQQIGITQTTVTNAGFLTALYVALVPLLAYLLMRVRPHWLVWPTALGCLLGTWMLSGGHQLSINVGDLWVIASSFFWALHVLFVGRLAERFKASFFVAAAQFLVCGVLSLTWALCTETFSWQAIYQVRWPIIYAGALSVGFAYTAQVFAQRHTEAADAAIIISAETIFAALFGYWLMGDRLDTLGIIGGALIFGCISVVQLVPLWAKIRLKAVQN